MVEERVILNYGGDTLCVVKWGVFEREFELKGIDLEGRVFRITLYLQEAQKLYDALKEFLEKEKGKEGGWV